MLRANWSWKKSQPSWIIFAIAPDGILSGKVDGSHLDSRQLEGDATWQRRNVTTAQRDNGATWQRRNATTVQRNDFGFLFDLICTLKVRKRIFFPFPNFISIVQICCIYLKLFEFVGFPGPPRITWICRIFRSTTDRYRPKGMVRLGGAAPCLAPPPPRLVRRCRSFEFVKYLDPPRNVWICQIFGSTSDCLNLSNLRICLVLFEFIEILGPPQIFWICRISGSASDFYVIWRPWWRLTVFSTASRHPSKWIISEKNIKYKIS